MVKFIKNPDQQSTDLLYRMPGRTTTVRNLKSLHVRLFDFATEDREEVSDPTMTSRLSLLLDRSEILNPVLTLLWKKCNFSLLEEKILPAQDLYLRKIPPTSVDTERVFSAGGLFLTKLWTNLSDISLAYWCSLDFLKTEKCCDLWNVLNFILCNLLSVDIPDFTRHCFTSKLFRNNYQVLFYQQIVSK